MQYIKNHEKLATTKSRKNILEIIEAGLNKVNPYSLVKESVRYNDKFNSVIIQNNSFDIISGRIFVIGGGKASGYMANALEEIIGSENIAAGIINSVKKDYKTKKIKIIKASHPIPDKNGVKGVENMLALKEKYKINHKDLVVCLISGGGSALMPCPVDEIDLEEKQETTSLLLESGADINEINTVRKHLSKIKGGQLAKHFSPAKVVSIIISDVVGNNLSSIASGPTVSDDTTPEDAYTVLEKYELIKKIPDNIKNYLNNKHEIEVIDMSEKTSPPSNYIIGDSSRALSAMAFKAKSLKLKPLIVSSEVTGDPEKVAEKIAEEIKNNKYDKYNVLLFGGETTPVIPEKHGQGGRNQHLAAATVKALEEYNANWTMASMATDGVDFIEDAAGVIIDNDTLSQTREKELDIDKYIKKFDSFNLFNEIGGSLIKTGPTGTNVGDVFVYLLE